MEGCHGGAQRLVGVEGFPKTYSSDQPIGRVHANPNAFDVLIRDYKMSGGPGFDVIRAAKAIRCDKPVVLMSRHVSDNVSEQAMRVDANAALAKQCLATDLLPVLGQLLSRASAPGGCGAV
jgi:two-component system cell cycle sensor histidine kinase/response regulator CckA